MPSLSRREGRGEGDKEPTNRRIDAHRAHNQVLLIGSVENACWRCQGSECGGLWNGLRSTGPDSQSELLLTVVAVQAVVLVRVKPEYSR